MMMKMMVEMMWEMMLETMLVGILQAWILGLVEILQLGLELVGNSDKSYKLTLILQLVEITYVRRQPSDVALFPPTASYVAVGHKHYYLRRPRT